MKLSLAGLLLALILAGCASPVPPAIRADLPGVPSVSQVRAEGDLYRDKRVRWGGTIAKVENRADDTWVEIVSRKLESDGRPYEDDHTDGRFIARIEGFLDPVIYEKGRLLTVVGAVEEQLAGAVGEFPYRFPVVRVTSYYLWQPRPNFAHRRYDPFWDYDPFDPFYHRRYWPYRRYP